MDLSSIVFGTNIWGIGCVPLLGWKGGERHVLRWVQEKVHSLPLYKNTVLLLNENNSLCSTKVNSRCLPPLHLRMRTDRVSEPSLLLNYTTGKVQKPNNCQQNMTVSVEKCP